MVKVFKLTPAKLPNVSPGDGQKNLVRFGEGGGVEEDKCIVVATKDYICRTYKTLHTFFSGNKMSLTRLTPSLIYIYFLFLNSAEKLFEQ